MRPPQASAIRTTLRPAQQTAVTTADDLPAAPPPRGSHLQPEDVPPADHREVAYTVAVSSPIVESDLNSRYSTRSAQGAAVPSHVAGVSSPRCVMERKWRSSASFRTCAAWARHDCSCPRTSAGRAFAKATTATSLRPAASHDASGQQAHHVWAQVETFASVCCSWTRSGSGSCRGIVGQKATWSDLGAPAWLA
jgi:hypothetical protein